ncbi:hypothetical protein CALCODRAFT_59305 [Calocera cornea HHB12733]|uniref:Uncharacterized protein n=1 Tax=Calocera cornea HHB12733 TaxID=1353952 RepID=A0A165IWY8_9BASI|nr:hypothetical protein CALCODRAFT_59305 [Calocera cornea HHB12733]
MFLVSIDWSKSHCPAVVTYGMTPPLDALVSSEAFIRALRAPHDPPTSSSPCKVELAMSAWAARDLYIPGKAELIADWALTRLLKDRSNKRTLLDHRYWRLLSSICSPGQDKSWLHPVLAKVPTVPIFCSLFESLRGSNNLPKEFFIDVANVYESTAPISISKANPDVLFEFIAAAIRVVATQSMADISSAGSLILLSDAGFPQYVALVLRSLLETLDVVSGRKRLLMLFLNDYVVDWARAVAFARKSPFQSLHPCGDALFDIGHRLLYNPETLRLWTEDLSLWQIVLDKVADRSQQVHVLSPLPLLLAAFVSSVQQDFGTLPSSSLSTTGLAALREASTPVLQHMLAFISSYRTDDAWRCRQDIMSLAMREHLYDASNDASVSAMGQLVQAASLHLQTHCRSQQTLDCAEALNIIDFALQIDFSLVDKHIDVLLSSCVHMGPELDATFGRILKRILDFYSRTRSLEVLLTKICDQLCSIGLNDTPSEDICATYMDGPLFSTPWERALSVAVANFLPPGQVVGVCERLNYALLETYTAQVTPVAQATARPRKRRRTGSHPTNDDGITINVARFRILSHYGAFLYKVLLHWETPGDLFQAVADQLAGLSRGLLEGIDEIDLSDAINASSRTDHNKFAGVLRISSIGLDLDAEDNLAASFASHAIVPGIMLVLASCRVSQEVWTEAFQVVLKLLSTSASRGTDMSRQAIDAFLGHLGVFWPISDSEGTPPFHTMGALRDVMITDGLALIERAGTKAQLRLMAEIMVEYFERDPHTAKSLFSCASFWELPLLRDELLHCLQTICQPLLALDLQSSEVSQSALDAAEQFTATLDLLVLAPPAYFDSADRVWLLRALIAMDLKQSQEPSHLDPDSDRRAKVRGMIATLLVEATQLPVTWTDLVRRMLVVGIPQAASPAFVHTTMKVINILQR